MPTVTTYPGCLCCGGGGGDLNCQLLGLLLPPTLRAQFGFCYPTDPTRVCECMRDVVVRLRRDTTAVGVRYFGRMRPAALGGDVVSPAGWTGCSFSGGYPGLPFDSEYLVELLCADACSWPCRCFIGPPPAFNAVEFRLNLTCCRFLNRPGPITPPPGCPLVPPGPEFCIPSDALWWYEPYPAGHPFFPVTPASFHGCLSTLGPPCTCGSLDRSDCAGGPAGMTCVADCVPPEGRTCQAAAHRSTLDPLRLVFEGIEGGLSLGAFGDRIGKTCVCTGAYLRVVVTI